MREKMNNMTAGLAVASTPRLAGVAALITGALLAFAAQAQNYPVTANQRATAQQVAARGVPVSELVADAPDTYVVKRGDTLWGISGMYLNKPWRWPELWGMNLQSIANPHLIYPGQTLYLEKVDGMARLTTRAGSGESETVRISPRTRYDSVSGVALPTIQLHIIEPFLAEPEVVEELTLEQAPRIVAAAEKRAILSRGDRVYARGPQGAPLTTDPGEPRDFRIFREAKPMKDPETGEILGYEALYVGRAELVRSETVEQSPDGKGGRHTDPVPATLDIGSVREEVRPGDRLLPLAKRSFMNFVPHAPHDEVEARVVSVYGADTVNFAGQNQVVAINRGTNDGMVPGIVLTVLTKGDRVLDKTAGQRSTIKLPSEANGSAIVFRTFDRVSYVLLLKPRYGVQVGDRLVNPQ